VKSKADADSLDAIVSIQKSFYFKDELERNCGVLRAEGNANSDAENFKSGAATGKTTQAALI
jgi:hypothetical protein